MVSPLFFRLLSTSGMHFCGPVCVMSGPRVSLGGNRGRVLVYSGVVVEARSQLLHAGSAGKVVAICPSSRLTRYTLLQSCKVGLLPAAVHLRATTAPHCSDVQWCLANNRNASELAIIFWKGDWLTQSPHIAIHDAYELLCCDLSLSREREREVCGMYLLGTLRHLCKRMAPTLSQMMCWWNDSSL